MSEQSRYRDPPFTVDAVIEHDGKLALIERGEDPFDGTYALPGGHVDPEEHPEDAVVREVSEETGLHVEVKEELKDYSQQLNDPRYDADEFEHRAYRCTPITTDIAGGDDAAAADWYEISDVLTKIHDDEIAFGHETIINDYIQQYTDD